VSSAHAGHASLRPSISRRPRWWQDAQRIDVALYTAVARTATPSLDHGMSRLSHAANHSRLWVAAAAALTTVGGAQGRRAAASGLAAVGVTSAVVNLGLKPLSRRGRPRRDAGSGHRAATVPMPASRSFPSGHAASAFAFVTGVAHVLPAAAVPLRPLAAAVAYSRVHTGVHYPADVLAGALIGTTVAQITGRALDRRWSRS
jgi:membrane-associated phospholipid phosphatase